MTPLLSAEFPIPLHAFAALAAILLGAVQLYLPKGTRLHKILGWTWVGLMAMVALTSFFIHEIKLVGNFSPIHLLSILTLFNLAYAIRAARLGNIRAHQRAMKWLYGLALVVTGLFTLLPGRIMYQVLFG